MLVYLTFVTLATYGTNSGERAGRRVRGRGHALMGLRAAVKGVAITLCGRAPGRHSGFVGLMGRKMCSDALFRQIVGRFVVRTNSPSDGGTSSATVLNDNSINCAVPTRFGPGFFRGGKMLTTTHRNSSIGPRGTSSNYRFCVIAKHGFARPRLLNVRGGVGRRHRRTLFSDLTHRRVGRVCGVHGTKSGTKLLRLRSALRTRTHRLTSGRRGFHFAPRRVGTCDAVNNTPRLSNSCAMFNRMARNVRMISGVRVTGAGHTSHPVRGVQVLGTDVRWFTARVVGVGQCALSGKLHIVRGRSGAARVITLGLLCSINTHSRSPSRAKFTRLFRRLVFKNSIRIPSCSAPMRGTKNRGGT